MSISARTFTHALDRLPHLRYAPLLLIPLLTLPAVWRLATATFFLSDDGILHLWRLRGLDDALQHGIFYPRIFPQFAFGYGHAVLSYYGPLSYYAAELIHLLGADFPDAIKWTFALGYIGGGYSAYLLARRFVALPAALLAAVAYIYFPYHLVDTFQRGALAEHLAWVFLPLILCSITPQTDAPPRMRAWQRALFIVSVAALICTHSISALIFMPAVVVYYALLNAHRSWRGRALDFALLLLGALSLSAFYWLPVAAQSRWVELSDVPLTTDFANYSAPTANFIQTSLMFDYERPEGYPDHPLALADAALLLAALFVLLRDWRTRQPALRPFAFFVGLSVLSLFMVVDASLPIWNVLRAALAFLQFPWRFMVLAGLGIALSAAFVFRRHAWLALCAIALLVVSVMPGPRFRGINAAPSDIFSMWHSEFKQQVIGSTWTEEYMPWWVSDDALTVPRPLTNTVSPVGLASPQITLLESGYTYRRYRVQTDAATILRFHQFYFPQWHVTLDGRTLQTYPSTDLGLLSADVPHSDGVLDVDFASTRAEQVGTLLSLAMASVLGYLMRGRWLIGVAFVAVLCSAALIFKAGPLTHAQPIHAQLEDVAELVAVQLPTGPQHAGDSVPVTLTWLARRETRENLSAFVHMEDARSGRLLAQSDGAPVGGFTPTSQWRVGEVIEDTRVLAIPADAPTGTFQITAGLYRNQPLKNLAALHNGQTIADGRIPIASLQVVAR